MLSEAKHFPATGDPSLSLRMTVPVTFTVVEYRIAGGPDRGSESSFHARPEPEEGPSENSLFGRQRETAMKKRRGVLLIVLGLVLAAVSGFMVLEVARRASQPSQAQASAQAQAIKKVYVVVAEKDLPDNTLLSATDLSTKEFPEDFAPKDAIAAPELAVGKYTTSRVYKGQIVVAPLLSATRRYSLLSGKVPDGKVAMAVTVNDAMNSTGALRPGDMVDILLTVDLAKGLSKDGQAPSGSNPQPQPSQLLSTQVTIQDVAILAVGAPGSETQDASNKNQQNNQQAQRTITFLLDHQDSVTLKFVKDSGGIMDIVVRSPDDKKLVKTEGVTFDRIYNQFHFRFPEPIR